MDARIEELQRQLEEERNEVARYEELCSKARLGEVTAQDVIKDLKALCASLQADGEQYRSLLAAKDKAIADLTERLLHYAELVK